MNTFNLAIPGFSIACKAWGNPEAPLILALHGWLDNANSFDLLAPYLSTNFYLVAVDLPGHGHSSHLPPGCYYHLIDGIFTTLQIIDALQCKQVHLLGHSLGGCLASVIAGVAPERVKSVACIEALGPLTAPDYACQKQLALYVHNDPLIDSKPKKSYPSLQIAAEARATRGYLSVMLAKILCERGMYEEDGAFYWRHDKRLLVPSPLRMTEAQVLSCLSTITAKSMLCWANEGFEFGEEKMQARIKAVKELRVVQLSGGHHIHMEKPEEVGGLLREFF
jgi:pimeloyl-ACP methyl ester carboxylesterase